MKTFGEWLKLKEENKTTRSISREADRVAGTNFHFANAEVEIDGNNLNIYSKTNQIKISVELSADQVSKLTQDWIKSKGDGGYGVYPNASYYVYGDPSLNM